MRTILATALLLTALDAAAQCTTVAAICPTVVTAALTSDDCLSYDGSRYDLLQFSGTAGTTITIDLRATSFDAFLGLIDPSGVPVAVSDDASPGSTDAQLVYTLTSSGTWTVVANNLRSDATGSYELAIAGCAAGPRSRAARH